MNFYPFHIGDYISHTAHLTNEEDLAYRRLIDLYYLTEKPLINDIPILARRTKSKQEAVLAVLGEFFELDEGKVAWTNKRATEELSRYKAMAEGGRKGAAKRWNKEIPTLLPSDSPPKHPPMPTKNHEPRTKNQINTKTPEGVNDSVFQDFLKLRKSHKAPLTETALKGLAKEAAKAKMTLEAVMELCCQRGWRGFKADWVENIDPITKTKELPLGTDAQIEAAYRAECGDPSKARFNSYYEMRNFIVAQREKRKAAN